MPTRISSNLEGSWFPTGYYGHYRSKVRNDYVNEYRLLARPQPPQKFFQRSVKPASAHSFSHHDNRNSFMNDASYFAQGLGKKRIAGKSDVYKPDFIAWCPNKEWARPDRPLSSTYRMDFRLEQPSHQLIVKRPKTSFDGYPTSTYRAIHGNESPNKDLINAMNNESLMLNLQSRQRQARQRAAAQRETVASCMSWYRPRVPQATTITNYDCIDMVPNNDTDLKYNNTNNSSNGTQSNGGCGESAAGPFVPHPPPPRPAAASPPPAVEASQTAAPAPSAPAAAVCE